VLGFTDHVRDQSGALRDLMILAQSVDLGKLEDMLGVDVVGRAHERLDLGDREFARAQVDRRIGRGDGRRSGPSCCGEPAGHVEPTASARVELCRAVHADERLEPLHEP
jgi:hypothetical protein